MKIIKKFIFLSLFFTILNGPSLKASAGEDGLLEQLVKEEEEEISKSKAFQSSQDDVSDQNSLKASLDQFVKVSAKFKEELQNHKASAILLRGTVPRANGSYKEGEVNNVFDIDFEGLKSFIDEGSHSSDHFLLNEWEEKVCFLIRVFQAISEDQNYLIAWVPEQYSRKKLDNIHALEGTVNILEKNKEFALIYNLFIKDIYTLLWEHFPRAAVFSHDIYSVGDAIVSRFEHHKSVTKSFEESTKSLEALFNTYNAKLTIREKGITLLNINAITGGSPRSPEIQRTRSEGKIKKLTQKIPRVSTPRGNISNDKIKSRSDTMLETQLPGLYGLAFEERKPRKSKKSSSPKKSSKKKEEEEKSPKKNNKTKKSNKKSRKKDKKHKKDQKKKSPKKKIADGNDFIEELNGVLSDRNSSNDEEKKIDNI